MTEIRPRLRPRRSRLGEPLLAGRRLDFVAPAAAVRTPDAVDLPASGRIWARRYRWILRITDMVAVAGATAIALTLGQQIPGVFPGPAVTTNQLIIAGLVVVSWIATLSIYHTRDSRVVGIGVTEYKRVAAASGITFGVLACVFLLAQVDTARGVFLVALPVGIAALMLERWLWRKWLLHQRRFGHYLARAVVVGQRDDVEYVVAQIEQKSGAAYAVVGVTLEPGDSGPLVVNNVEIPVIGDTANAAAAAARLGADAVIVAGQPPGGGRFIRKLGWQLEGTTAELVLSSRLTDIAGPRIHFRPVEGLPLIHVEIPAYEGASYTIKRAFDLITSTLALVVLMPLMIAIAVAVALDSPGPILFRQPRVGRNGQMFLLTKFRSMRVGAENELSQLAERNQGAGVLFKIRQDPRVTRVGRFIRRYSLDELPQLWNILLGHMSVVGPRPPLRQEVQSYRGKVHRRLYIKPGLTGLWQISGRSDLGWDDSVRLDLYYVENWSLTGDLMIIWRTFKAVLSPRGAY